MKTPSAPDASQAPRNGSCARMPRPPISALARWCGALATVLRVDRLTRTAAKLAAPTRRSGAGRPLSRPHSTTVPPCNVIEKGISMISSVVVFIGSASAALHVIC